MTQRVDVSVPSHRRGAVLIITFLMMLMLTGLALAVGVFSQNSLVTGQSQLFDKQAFFIAEAGLQRARQLLGTGERAVGCGENVSFGAGEYNVVTAIATGGTLTGGFYTMTSDGFIPNDTSPVARRQLLTQRLTPTITLGANLSLAAGVSAITSSSNGVNTAEPRARDNDNATFWEAGGIGAGSWVGMDHGSAIAVDEIIIREQGNTITSLAIEWSDNGSTWTAVSCLAISAAPASGTNQVYTTRFNQETHRFFRALMTGVPAGSLARVREMQDYDTTLTLTAGRTLTQF